MKAGAIGVFLMAGWLLVACGQQSDPELLPVTNLSVPQDCDVLAGCRVADEGVQLEVLFPVQPRALQPFPVTIQSVGGTRLTAASVSFTMRGMSMGLNRYVLKSMSADKWEGEVTLPVCVSGRADWIAEFDIRLSGRSVAFSLPFVLEK
jgi:hypothetical protein